MLYMHGRHAQNLAPLGLSKLHANDAVDARADGVTGFVDENAGIVVESDDRAVLALDLVLCADNNGVADISALDLVGGGQRGGALVGVLALLLDDDDDAVTWKSSEICLSNER